MGVLLEVREGPLDPERSSFHALANNGESTESKGESGRQRRSHVTRFGNASPRSPRLVQVSHLTVTSSRFLISITRLISRLGYAASSPLSHLPCQPTLVIGKPPIIARDPTRVCTSSPNIQTGAEHQHTPAATQTRRYRVGRLYRCVRLQIH